jgi:hypothetical protein
MAQAGEFSTSQKGKQGVPDGSLSLRGRADMAGITDCFEVSASRGDIGAEEID